MESVMLTFRICKMQPFIVIQFSQVVNFFAVCFEISL